MLRKGKVEYSKPLTPEQVQKARAAIKSSRTEPQLTYAELDQVIRLGRAHVPQFIASGSIQPQGAVAWEQRLRDPGSAPVPGENVQYVVAMNGRVKVSVAFSKATQTQPYYGHLMPTLHPALTNPLCQVSEKAMTPADIERTHTQADRKYYLERVKKAMDNIFEPIFAQQAARTENSAEERKRTVEQRLKQLLWPKLGRPLQTSAERKRKCVEASPIMQAFAKQQRRAP